jgi:hypothetical protein
MACPDMVVAPKYVLLVTDGAPNCTNGGGGGGGGIGYNTKSDAQLSGALDRMAQAGDTGDKQRHAIEDGMALATEFQKIAGAAAACEFVLNTQPSDPSHVEVNRWQADQPQRSQRLVDQRGSPTHHGARQRLRGLASKKQHLGSVRVLCEPVVLQ